MKPLIHFKVSRPHISTNAKKNIPRTNSRELSSKKFCQNQIFIVISNPPVQNFHTGTGTQENN